MTLLNEKVNMRSRLHLHKIGSIWNRYEIGTYKAAFTRDQADPLKTVLLIWRHMASFTKVVPCPSKLSTIDDYAKDGGPGEVRHLCSFYQDPLRP